MKKRRNTLELGWRGLKESDSFLLHLQLDSTEEKWNVCPQLLTALRLVFHSIQ